MRQTWEEIGLDLAERDYMCIGQLDDREITTSLGKRLLMILSPYVFLQLTPNAPLTDPVSSTTLHWTPLASLVSSESPPKWSTVTVDAASRLAPKHSIALRLLVRFLVGTMQFPAIIVDPSPSSTLYATSKHPLTQDTLEKGVLPLAPQHLKLWGLSLGMTLDLTSYMIPTPSASYSKGNGKYNFRTPSPMSAQMQLPYQSDGEDGMRIALVSPSLASVFPRFSYPDVNFWIWCVYRLCVRAPANDRLCGRVFGKRYREVVRGWEASVRGGGANDRRYVLLSLPSVRLDPTSIMLQNKLVWIRIEHLLRCYSQSVGCSHRGTRTGSVVWSGVCGVVGFQHVK
jgi:hypothetical protein